MNDPAIFFFVFAGIWQVTKWAHYILVYIILFFMGIFTPFQALKLVVHMMKVQNMDTQVELNRFNRLRAIYQVLNSRISGP